jgi:cyclic pyranopterin monophosphate synthase
MWQQSSFPLFCRNGKNISRRYLSDLSHVDVRKGLPKMVNVSAKQHTLRTASARVFVVFPVETFKLLKDQEHKSAKGPIISTAIVAGVLGAKKTPDLIPFCHPVPMDGCDIAVTEVSYGTGASGALNAFQIDCLVTTTYKTGIEMEALVGVNCAALCVYDMCKALTHDIIIADLQLMSKTGGKCPFSRS